VKRNQLPVVQVVSREEGAALAEKLEVMFFETSAKADINVNTAFQTIADLVVDRLREEAGIIREPAGSIKLSASGDLTGQSAGCWGLKPGCDR
jgi:hypothetical protein